MSGNTVGHGGDPRLTTMVHSAGNSEDSSPTPLAQSRFQNRGCSALRSHPPPMIGVAGLWEGKVSGSISPLGMEPRSAGWQEGSPAASGDASRPSRGERERPQKKGKCVP